MYRRRVVAPGRVHASVPLPFSINNTLGRTGLMSQRTEEVRQTETNEQEQEGGKWKAGNTDTRLVWLLHHSSPSGAVAVFFHTLAHSASPAMRLVPCAMAMSLAVGGPPAIPTHHPPISIWACCLSPARWRMRGCAADTMSLLHTHQQRNAAHAEVTHITTAEVHQTRLVEGGSSPTPLQPHTPSFFVCMSHVPPQLSHCHDTRQGTVRHPLYIQNTDLCYKIIQHSNIAHSATQTWCGSPRHLTTHIHTLQVYLVPFDKTPNTPHSHAHNVCDVRSCGRVRAGGCGPA